MTDEELDQMERDVEHAHQTIAAICRGEQRWRMSIPARPDEDPDLVISRALSHASRLIEAWRGGKR